MAASEGEPDHVFVMSSPQGSGVYIPIDPAGNLKKSTLVTQFPQAIGLRYQGQGGNWIAIVYDATKEKFVNIISYRSGKTDSEKAKPALHCYHTFDAVRNLPSDVLEKNVMALEQLQEIDFNDLFTSLVELLNFSDQKESNPTSGDIEYCQEHINLAIQSLRYIELHLTDRNASLEVLQDIRKLITSFQTTVQKWNNLSVTITNANPSEPVVAVENEQLSRTGVGRPSFILDVEKVLFLFSVGFKKKDIAKCFLINRITMNIDLVQFAEIRDDNLIVEIEEIYKNHPHSGVSVMHGHLKAKGIIVKKKEFKKFCVKLIQAVLSLGGA